MSTWTHWVCASSSSIVRLRSSSVKVGQLFALLPACARSMTSLSTSLLVGLLIVGVEMPAAAGAQRIASFKVSTKARLAAIRRAQVWAPTDVASMDLKTGPAGPDAFAPNELVTCQYLDKPMSGATPKFTCVIGQDDELKVKYGAENGEVYGEGRRDAAAVGAGVRGGPHVPGARGVSGLFGRSAYQQARDRRAGAVRSRRRRAEDEGHADGSLRPTPAGRGRSWTRCRKPPAARRARTAMR